MPVDHEAVASERPCAGGGQQREIGKRRGMYDVVAATVKEQVPKYASAEDERRQDAAPARPRVETHPRTDNLDLYARYSWVDPAIPLPQRQIGHLVPVGGQALG